MTEGPASSRSRSITGTAGLIAAVLAASWVSAAAQDRRSGGVREVSVFENGRQQYHRTCAQCHGRNMVNSGVTVYDLRNFPVDQPERFFNSITNGKGDMPSFRDALSGEQMRWLWAYVSSRGTPP